MNGKVLPIFLIFLLGGCQYEPLGNVIPVYSSSAEAAAVASGQLGVLPDELLAEGEINPGAISCAGNVARATLSSGKVVWFPAAALPPAVWRAGCRRGGDGR